MTELFPRNRPSPAVAPVTPILRSALVVTAALSLGVVLLGGFETNVRLWAKLDPAHLHLAQSTFMTRGPRSVAELLLAVLLLPGWFAWRAQRGYAHKGVVVWLVAAALLAGALAGASGFAGITGTSIAAWHAIVGHVVFACIAAATVFALTGSPDAPDSPAPKLQIIGGFPLRPFAPWLPPLVVTQVAMGAAYRHGQWGVLPHLIGAMVVAFLLVAESVLLLQRAPEHRLLRRAAHWALGAVLLQVALGVLDYLVRLLDFQDTTAWFALSLAHVTVGSITLAGTIYLAVSVRICILNPVITPQPTLNS